MKIGIGYQNESDAVESGVRLAESAMKNGNIDHPSLALAFCGGSLDADGFFRGLRSVIGLQTPIIGGSAIGVITNEHLSYEGHPAGVAILESEDIRCDIAAAGSLDRDEKHAGITLAKKLPCPSDSKLMLMFYDSIKISATSDTPPVMNASPRLIAGIEDTLGPEVPIIGAGVLADISFGPTRQFCGDFVESQHVVGAMLSGDFEPCFRIMHGCVPMDGLYHTITKIEGPVIYEADGRPIVALIDEIYGSREWQNQLPVRRLSIGVNMGDKYDDFREEHYVNRLIAGVLPGREGIVIFEPDLETGTEIQFMLRDVETIMASARKNSSQLMSQIHAEGKTPLFGLYIDCAGRCASVSETLSEEAAEIISVFNHHHIPLLGFYSGVEVAPLQGKTRGLDWTGVLMVMARG